MGFQPRRKCTNLCGALAPEAPLSDLLGKRLKVRTTAKVYAHLSRKNPKDLKPIMASTHKIFSTRFANSHVDRTQERGNVAVSKSLS